MPQIGNTNVVDLGGSAYISPIGGSAVLISGATVRNGVTGQGVVYLGYEGEVFNASNTTIADTHGEHALFMNAGTANLNNTTLYGNAYLRHGNGSITVNLSGNCVVKWGAIGFIYNSSGYSINIAAGATIDLTGNATAEPIFAADGITFGANVKVITSAGATMNLNGGIAGTCSVINNDGTIA